LNRNFVRRLSIITSGSLKLKWSWHCLTTDTVYIRRI